MAEAISLDPSIPADGALIADQPGGPATSERDDRSEEVRDATKLNIIPLLFILDHTGKNYPIPWEKGQNFSVRIVFALHLPQKRSQLFLQQFKSYAEEIYARKGEHGSLEKINDDQFDVALVVDHEDRIILPSLWDALVHEGATVRILFWSDEHRISTQRHSLSRDQVFEVIDDTVVQNDQRDEQAYGTQSPHVGSLTHSDHEDIEESESASEDDDLVSVPPPAEPVRAVIKPVDEEGNPLSVEVDTKWIAEHMFASKEDGSSKDSLLRGPREAHNMTTQALKIKSYNHHFRKPHHNGSAYSSWAGQ
ncbi:hypothetical protein N0V90_007025 [Kalmusia sp. IMI 367209]|nr:hypothetical protein N0V90_007025 [Kalmusia sp. IMI 367209]